MTSAGLAKPRRARVASVSGSSSSPVKTRLPSRGGQRRRRLEQRAHSGRWTVAERRRAAPSSKAATSAIAGHARRRPPSASSSSGSVWVCSSSTICRRCSTRAQEAIGLRSARRARPASIQPPSASAASMSSVPAAAQLGIAAAGDQLLGLDEELDLADAAAAELDVVAGDRDLAVAADGRGSGA